MCNPKDIERKTREIIDMPEINSLCDQLIELSGKTQRTGFNYTESMVTIVDDLKKLFEETRAEAINLVIAEVDRESEEELEMGIG